MNYSKLNLLQKKGSVVLFGSTTCNSIPVSELAKSFEFDFSICNRSFPELSIQSAKSFFIENIEPINPEAVLIQLGEKDYNLFINNSNEFDKEYLSLINYIKSTNKKCRIGLISIYNNNSSFMFTEMNRHIKAIANSEKCEFFNLDTLQPYNYSSLKDAIDFAKNMGLNIKKPLYNITQALFSYVIENQDYENKVKDLAV